jgi:outer membrane protein
LTTQKIRILLGEFRESMKKIILIFITLFTGALSSSAQQTWSLKQCIDYALKNNIQIKQSQLNVDLAEMDLLQSKAAILPNLNGSASHAYNYGRTVDMYTNQFATQRVQSDNFYLSTSVTVFNGFQLLNTIKQNRLNLQASKLDIDKMMNDMSLNIATAYLQILYNYELLDIAKNQVKITQQQVDRMQKIVDVGNSAKGPLLTLQAQAASEEVQVVSAQNQLDLSFLTLSQMLDLDSTSAKTFEIEKPNIDVTGSKLLLTEPEKIFAYAVTNQPEIKSSEIKYESAVKGLNIAQSNRYPSLSFRASWGTGYSGASKKLSSVEPMGWDTIGVTEEPTPVAVLSPAFSYSYKTTPFNDQIKDNENKSIGLYLSVPIFNNLRTSTAVKRAKINIQNADYNLQTAKNNLNKSVNQAYADAKAALNKYNASQKAVDAMQESFKYAEQKFEAGMMNTTDYDDSKNKLTKAKSDLLQAKYEYVFRIKILDFYLGNPITLQ